MWWRETVHQQAVSVRYFGLHREPLNWGLNERGFPVLLDRFDAYFSIGPLYPFNSFIFPNLSAILRKNYLGERDQKIALLKIVSARIVMDFHPLVQANFDT